MADWNALAQGWWQWMGPMLVQIGVLILLIGAVDLLFRHRIWPQLRLALWGLVFVKLLVPPTWTTSWSVAAWLRPAIPAAQSADASAPAVAQAVAVATGGISWELLLFGVWLLGIAAVLTLRVCQWRSLQRRWFADAVPASATVARIATAAARQIGLRRTPRVRVSPAVAGPAVVGLWRPTVILPEELLSALDHNDLRHVFLHEFAHVKRGDLWFGLGADLLGAVYWLQPLLWMVGRRFAALREVCCDATVVRALRGGADAYHRTLLRSAQLLLLGRPAQHGLGAAGFFGGRNTLIVRLEQLQRGSSGGRGRSLLVALIAAGAFLGLLPMGQRCEAMPRRSPESSSIAEHVAAEVAAGKPVSCWSVRAAAFAMIAEQQRSDAGH